MKYDLSRIETAILKAITASGMAPEKSVAGDMARKVEAALAATYQDRISPSVEDIQDIVESVLMENRMTRVARNYIIYRHKRAMARAARASEFEVTDNVPYKKLYEILRWNMEHSCDTVQNLNRLIRRKQMPDLIHAADARYKAEIRLAGEQILEKRNDIRLVIIAGPSSSGKTTTTIKLSEMMKEHNISLKTINIDHYFFDLEKHPRDEFGDYDYEKPEALDLSLINRHLAELMEGRTIRTPHYDFKKGLRALDVHELSLNRNEILLIDSLHGLHEPMTQSVNRDNKFRLYIETLGQFKTENGAFMRWADNRLLRRMIRDKDHRNLKPMQTLTHWHYVRRSELTNIIPYIKKTDFIINSALPYELPILKYRLFSFIARAIHNYHEDPRRLDAHIRANRIYSLLKPIHGIRNIDSVPKDSLLREFIGGSRYKY